MRYLLDTCVISDFIKSEAGTTARLKQTPPLDIAISAIRPLSSFRPPMAISRIVRLNQSPEDPAPHGLHLTEEAGRSA